MIVLLLIVSTFLSALCRTCYKLAMRTSDEVAVVIATQVVSATVSLPLIFIFFPTHAFDWHLLIAEAFLWGLYVYLEIRSLRHLDLGLAVILGSAEYVLQILIGIFFFHEHLAGFRGLGFALIVLGIIASANWRLPHVQKGMLYQIFAVTTAVCVLPIDAVLVHQISPWFVGAFAYLGPSLVLLCWRKRERAEAFRLIRTSNIIRLAGVANVCGYSLLMYLLTQWSFTDTVSGSELMVVFSLLLGWVVLGEREHGLRRALAGATIILGIAIFHGQLGA